MPSGSRSRRVRADDSLLCHETQALADLRQDFGELLYLARDAGAELASLIEDLDRIVPGQPVIEEQARLALARSREAASRLLGLRQQASTPGGGSLALVDELAAERENMLRFLRAERAVVAGLAMAADWQSPSFAHSVSPQAGRQLGRITPHRDDYKRDRHRDATVYERAYIAELVAGPPGARALLTGCGMAAFTTVLDYLLFDGKLDGQVLVGRALYHESKELLLRALGRQAVLVDESDARVLLGALDGLRPCAVFLDTLCNSRWMPLPDVAAVVGRLRGAYLVLDNTGLGPCFRPFDLPGAQTAKLIVFESLLKYAQLGLDRVNAGVIVAGRDDADALDGYREHLGTNVPDVCARMLPPPSRHVLERRLGRIWRNAALLADRVDGCVYPGVGGCISLPFADGALVERAIEEARGRGVSLVAGSSFGFDTTRIYLTAARSDHGEPFVRIAAGTENRIAIERLGDVLAAATAPGARLELEGQPVAGRS
jgi:cystathionine beta-lyase/cystathionine gamma-synthase